MTASNEVATSDRVKKRLSSRRIPHIACILMSDVPSHMMAHGMRGEQSMADDDASGEVKPASASPMDVATAAAAADTVGGAAGAHMASERHARISGKAKAVGHSTYLLSLRPFVQDLEALSPCVRAPGCLRSGLRAGQQRRAIDAVAKCAHTPLDPKTEAILDQIEKEEKEPKPPIDAALDMSALPGERGKKRMRPENIRNHFNNPMRKYNGAVLNFFDHRCEATLYDLQAMADLVWGRTLSLPEVLDIALFGDPCRVSTWTYIERGGVQHGDWPIDQKLEQDLDPATVDILLLRPCPTTKRWGPALAEYYGYKFEFDHDKSPYYYLRRTDNASAEA